MSWLNRIRATLLSLWHGEDIEADIEEELRFHLEMRTKDNVERGMTLAEAGQDALTRFGNLDRIEKQSREIRGISFASSFVRDIRYSSRMLIKHPVFTIVAVATLAIGIGGNTAIFSVVSAVLLRPLPYENADRIVFVWETNLRRGLDSAAVSPANFLDWKERNHVFDSLSAWRFWFYTLNGGNGEPERLHGVRTSAAFFPVFGVKPALGRFYLDEEEHAGHDHVVVLSYALWQRRFGASPNVIGQILMIDGEPFTVIGVLPQTFRFIRVLNGDLDLWMPLGFDSTQLDRQDHSIIVYGRLRDGVTVAQAQTEMDLIARGLAEGNPGTNSGWATRIVRLHDQYVSFAQPILLLVLAAVGFVLLIACANVANLLLARATGRRKETAIRTALGASRLRLIRQLLTESLLLALLGGAAGLIVAYIGIIVLNVIVPNNVAVRFDRFTIDPRVLSFTVMISVLAGFIFGMAPALQASKTDLTELLKEGSWTISIGPFGRRIRDLLVISEVALAVMLLIAAGLMIRSSLHLQEMDRGVNTRDLLTLQVSLPSTKYRNREEVITFYEATLERLKHTPGVEAVSAVNFLPFASLGETIVVDVEGLATPLPGQGETATYRLIDQNYFQTMGIPLMKGYLFTSKATEKNLDVVLVNESFARRVWPNEDPIGKRIKPEFPKNKVPWRSELNSSWLTVVGVVGDVRERVLTDQVEPEIYLPYFHFPSSSMTLLLRTKSEPQKMAPAIRKELGSQDKNLAIYNVKTMEEVAAERFSEPRALTLVLGIFATAAVFLAAIGIYGVVNYSVAQRTHEIGIRMALGARQRDVLLLILRQGMFLTLIGVVVGLGASSGLMRVMANLLFGVSSTDPLTFSATAALLAVVALVASYVPAARSARLDPLIALRDD
jgi:putative ABC transport system permease protein